MALTRWTRDHRPAFILAALVGISLVLLASGAHGGPVASGVRAAAELTALPFLMVFRYAEDGVRYGAGLVFEYSEGQKENRALRQKLAVMLQHVSERQELLLENRRLREMMAFELASPELTLRPVEVIKSFEGSLTIDQGSVHGLRESMCVIMAGGIVGLITEADLFTSNVITLQNTGCNIDAMVQGKRIRGKVRGTGNSLSSICVMEYIDPEADVVPGDMVVASPDSVFPSAYPIGRIVHVEENPGPLAKTAEVLPIADPFRADEVFVVLRSDPKWEDLAGAVSRDATLEEPGGLMDTSSIQERFAP